ncbi:MAG: sugar phosphate nucleotidyltransferase [Candidatus Woesebacteria bacterium]|jgi:mannose-1-phosphate guanylyltransferase
MSKDSYKNHLYALFLAGGGGTRLWPRSRNKTPKQFLPLFNKKTLTQITASRFREILPWDKIFVVTVSAAYKKEIIKEVPKLPSENIIVEPARRETGPAHGLGAVYIYKKDRDAVIITESADRLVKPVSKYLKTLLASAKVAYEEKVMVAMGVKPRYPHPGLGHIKRGKKWKKVNGVDLYKLEKFVEKPPLNNAKKYTRSGKHYWNAGEFVWRADIILESLRKNEPGVGKKLDEILPAIGTKSEKKVIQRIYNSMPKVAIDYAVAEKDKNFLVVVGDFFWTDIGDWNEVWKNLDHDEADNVIIDGDEPGGRVINLGTSDALVHTDGRLVAVIDVDNIIVVDTKNALLVCSKSKAQNVKKVVNKLKTEKQKEYL